MNAGPEDAPAPARAERLRLGLFTLAAVVVAIGMNHGAMFASRFREVQSSPFDTRFNHYILEHEYRWLQGDPLHLELWNPPIFYPASTNALAFSDTLLSFLPPYAAARRVGLDPVSAWQAWLLFMTLANVLAAVALFRCMARAPPFAAAAAALFFTVASPRMVQFDHHQLYPQAWLLLAAAGVAGTVKEAWNGTPRRFTAWPAVAALGLALQGWGGFYVMFFAVFAIAAGAVAGLLLRPARIALWNLAARSWPSLLAGGAVFLAAAAPLAGRYLAVQAQVGERTRSWVEGMLPHVQSWFFVHPANWLWGWTSRSDCFDLPYAGEHMMGMGVITTATGLAGLWIWRRDPRARWLALAVALMVVLTSQVAGRSLWFCVADVIPGASAMRAITRVWLVTILPVALALAAVLSRLERGGRRVAALALAAACVAEQYSGRGSGYDRDQLTALVSSQAGAVRRSAEAYCVTSSQPIWPPGVHLQGMWAGFECGRPTINGYSGNHPPGYQLDPVATNAAELERVFHQLVAWCDRSGVEPAAVDWIHDGHRMPFARFARRTGAGEDGAAPP